MVPVGLYDQIEITRPAKRDKGRKGLIVTCDHPLVPAGEGNLAYRAASLLLKREGLQDPLHIRIRKKIPVGGGLGGASSDAAATLWGINRLFRLGFGRDDMVSLAASLGADVPFFLYGHPARAQGIGKQLRLIPSFPRLWLVILYPGFPVSTSWVYGNLAFKLTKPIENTSINFSWENRRKFKTVLVNDLERVTIRHYPQVAFLKKRLVEEGAEGALMSGSGSSVFGIFQTEQKAKQAFRRLRVEEGVQAYLVRSLS